MQRAYDPQRINAIVLVASGHNVDPTDSDIDAILRALENQSENDWIRVFTVADGAQPDIGVLNQIARAAQASSYYGSNPATVGRVFNDVISNF
jgi:Ca-activated chloride channel homolog